MGGSCEDGISYINKETPLEIPVYAWDRMHPLLKGIISLRIPTEFDTAVQVIHFLSTLFFVKGIYIKQLIKLIHLNTSKCSWS